MVGFRREVLKSENGIYAKPTINVILDDENCHLYSKSGTKHRCNKGPSLCNKTKMYKNCKGMKNISLFATNIILYLEKPKHSTNNLVKVNKFSKVVENQGKYKNTFYFINK